MFDRMAQSREALETTLADARAKGPIDTDSLLARLAERGVPADRIEKLKDALDDRPRKTRQMELAEFRLAEIIRMNALGMRDHKIAAALAITRPYVCQVRRANGIPPVKARR